MKWRLFENKIKDDLSTHRTDVDADALWKAIEPDVDRINKKNRKKRRMVLWMFFAGTLLAGSVAAFFLLLNNPPAANDRIVHFDKKNNTQRNDFLNNKNKSQNNNDNSVFYENNKNENTDKYPLNNILNNKNENQNNNDNSVFYENNKNENTDKHPLNNILNNKNENQNNNDNPIFYENNKNKKNNPAVLDPEKTSLINRNAPTPPSIALRPLLVQYNTIGTPSGLLQNTSASPAPVSDKRHPAGKRYFHLALEINGGTSYAHRRLTTTDPVASPLIDLRNKTEKQLETSHLGLQIQVRHRSGFHATTGLQYTRINELFERQWMVIPDSIEGIVYYYVSPYNDTIAVMGRIPAPTRILYHKKYYNRHTLLDIPFVLGYVHGDSGWQWGAGAGIFANISLKSSGRFLINEEEDGDIKDFFKHNTGWSFYAAFSSVWPLTGNVELNIAPYIRYFPKSFSNTNYNISQKYILFGLNGRVSYRF